MSLSSELLERSASQCELCGSASELEAYTVPPKSGDSPEHQIAACAVCLEQIQDASKIETNHWRCLNDCMWSPVPAVQVVAHRMLNQLSTTDWAPDLLAQMYLADDTLEWAEHQAESAIVHKDSNGHILQAGDSVVLIKDLNVKGANFTAKRGTAVRRIRLDPDNANHIEGKVEGQQIVILTQYVKKS